MTFKEQAVEKGAWYLKHRTKIWAGVWFVVGLFGGNMDRITKYVPTLKIGNDQVQKQAEEYQEIQKKLQEIKKQLDKTDE